MNQYLAPILTGVQQFWERAQPFLLQTEDFLANPWARAVGLCLIVYATIRVIASVYSGDMQNSELGPIGIRPHAARRLDRKTVILPRLLMPMNMDGVTARMKLFYVYVDPRGKRRQQLVYTMHHARIGVSPVRLNKIQATIYGQEIPDVATEDVCFPPIDVEAAPADVPATPDRARDYAALHKIIENWTEDDDAPLISVHADEHEAIADARAQVVTRMADKVRAARKGNALQRWLQRSAAANRPNVVGNYFIKLEFSHDPWFVLTKHPDRDLKMTAWLTVLTSMFALVMDVWPNPRNVDEPRAAQTSTHAEPTRPPPAVRAPWPASASAGSGS